MGNGQRPEFEPGRFDEVIGSCSLFIWVKSADDVKPYRELHRQGDRFATSASSFFSTARSPRPAARSPRPAARSPRRTAHGAWALFPERSTNC